MGGLDVCEKPEDLGLSASRLARIGPFFEDKYVRSGKLPGVLTAIVRGSGLASFTCSGRATWPAASRSRPTRSSASTP